MPTLELAQVVLATVATVCMIGLGFLYRPGLATGLWSVAFVVTMVASYGSMIAAEIGAETLRVSAMGVLMSAPALIWAGVRAYRGVPSLAWVAVVIGVGSAVALALTSDTDAFAWAFRAVYAAVGVIAALTVIELLRLPGHGGGSALPLLAFSVIVLLAAIASLVAGLFAPTTTDLTFLRMVNSLGMLAYIVSALITLLFFARRGADATAVRSVFAEVASDRLHRAQAAGERSWALLYIQLDDADDLEQVVGSASFTALVDGLREDICEIFPTEADIGRFEPAAYAVLTAQSATVIRDRVRSLVRAVSTAHRVTRDEVPVGTSVSIGWAGVAEFGYEVDTLVDAARRAAERSAADGGDRWERATA